MHTRRHANHINGVNKQRNGSGDHAHILKHLHYSSIISSEIYLQLELALGKVDKEGHSEEIETHKIGFAGLLGEYQLLQKVETLLVLGRGLEPPASAVQLVAFLPQLWNRLRLLLGRHDPRVFARLVRQHHTKWEEVRPRTNLHHLLHGVSVTV